MSFSGIHLKISLRSVSKISLDGEIELHLLGTDGEDGGVVELDE